MLSTKKITIEAKTEKDGKAIAGHRAIIEGEKIVFLPYQIDAEAYKAERATVRADQAEFEDYAYALHENILKGEI